MSRSTWYCPLCQSEGAEPGVTFCLNDGTPVRPIEERGAEWIGKVLDGKYRVVRFIDAGGTAAVYEAERTTTGRRVALKLLHAELAARPEIMETFLQEAQLVSLVAHPNIVAIEDFGTLPGPIHYMVMEFLEGRALSKELEEGPLPVLTALRYAQQACEGLAAAHARDVIHCDIKPANIFLQRVPGRSEPVIKVLDLGIGRLFARGATAEAGTSATISGTPEYMSPEQARGEPLGPAADVYSMGVVLYEMLLGQLPFSAASYVTVLDQQVHEAPPWPEELADERGVPPEARDIVWRALAKQAAARQGSMVELQRDLAALGRREKAKATLRESAANARDATMRARTSPGGELPPKAAEKMVIARGRQRAARRPSGAALARTEQPLRTAEQAPSGSGRQTAPRRATGPALVRAEQPAPAREEPPSSSGRRAAARRATGTALTKIVPLAGASGADQEAVEIAQEVYWVGRRHGRMLEHNAFLRVFRRAGIEVSMLVDPGPPEDLEVVSRKVAAVIGSMSRIDLVFLSHPDPDVAGSAAPILESAPQASVICSEDTFRLARFYGLPAGRFIAVESVPRGDFKLATSHRILFVPTPFCHFRGAVMVYDQAARVLFSGDLCGGARAGELVASERSWPGVEMFHQSYMPARRALAAAVARVRALYPEPAVIAPHHGSLITGDDVPRMLDRIEHLEVGLDLLETPGGEARFLAAGNDMMSELAEIAGEAQATALLAGSADDISFGRLVIAEGGRITAFRVAPRLALEALASDALEALPADRRGDLQRTIRSIWKQHQIEPASPRRSSS